MEPKARAHAGRLKQPRTLRGTLLHRCMFYDGQQRRLKPPSRVVRSEGCGRWGLMADELTTTITSSGVARRSRARRQCRRRAAARAPETCGQRAARSGAQWPTSSSAQLAEWQLATRTTAAGRLGRTASRYGAGRTAGARNGSAAASVAHGAPRGRNLVATMRSLQQGDDF